MQSNLIVRSCRRWPSCSALALLTALCSALCGTTRPAEAQGLPAPSDVAAQLFEPTPAGDRFFGVPDGSVRGFMDGYAKLVLSHGHRPMGYRDDGLEYVSWHQYAYADLTLSLAHLLMLSVDVPVATVQVGDGGFDAPDGAPTTAFGDLRSTLRIGAWRMPREEAALGAQVDVWFPTGSVEDVAGDGAFRANPKLALSGTVDWFTYAVTAGYLFRERAYLDDAEVGGAITYGAAVGAQFMQGTVRIGPELYGQAVLPDPDRDGAMFDPLLTPAELLFGATVRYEFLVFGYAAGPGLTRAPGVASYRMVASLGFVEDHRVFDRDGDRLDDDRDHCPDEPGFDARGCPLPDRDGDTIVDEQDACPDLPGLVHVHGTKHGCPPR